MGNHYSPMNAENMAIGEDIKSSHLNHLGTLRKGIQATIECHQQLEGKPYIYTVLNPKKRYEFIFSTYNRIKALVIITTPLSFDFAIEGSVTNTTLVTTRVEVFFLFPCRTLDEVSCILSR